MVATAAVAEVQRASATLGAEVAKLRSQLDQVPEAPPGRSLALPRPLTSRPSPPPQARSTAAAEIEKRATLASRDLRRSLRPDGPSAMETASHMVIARLEAPTGRPPLSAASAVGGYHAGAPQPRPVLTSLESVLARPLLGADAPVPGSLAASLAPPRGPAAVRPARRQRLRGF